MHGTRSTNHEVPEMVLQMTFHAHAKLLDGAIFEQTDQVEVCDLTPGRFFFLGDEVSKNGQQHGLKPL